MGADPPPLAHCELLQIQLLLQVPWPVPGPSQVPLEHRLVAAHQPHPVDLVQLPQLVCAAQLPHWLLDPNCHRAQVPVLGPALVPGVHLLVAGHHPQPVVDAHPPHVVCAAHVWVEGALETQRELDQIQSAHRPLAGPR